MAKKNSNVPTHITLAAGQEEVDVPVTRDGLDRFLLLRRGRVHTVVPDDSQERGVGESLAVALVADGRCDACGEKGGVDKTLTKAIRDEAAAADAKLLEETRRQMMEAGLVREVMEDGRVVAEATAPAAASEEHPKATPAKGHGAPAEGG
jgi:hypothetical protein